ncbi:MAG: Farnesyl diphosphate synthase [Deltaproteobacteria bacterium ADurb.Bin510]|nr:MAG: Farnesyl diphosphate synthase [Deltaproteobacteria bacterium ADurb.Bin510]
METYKQAFEAYLAEYIATHEQGIAAPGCYSLAAGGKRLRPVLCQLACAAAGGRSNEALPAALALEMIHTFSLIHDDLPAIDNDDLRRGRPTCHRVYGEAAAILAGDMLIFEAFKQLAAAVYTPAVKADLLAYFAAAGADLIEGEHQDILAEGQDLSQAEILNIYLNKTARLFELSLMTGARIATAEPAVIARLRAAGVSLGLAFQAIDDILDVTADTATMGKTVGKDLAQDKATLVKIMGLEAARAFAAEQTGAALAALAGFDNAAGAELRKLATEMQGRLA